ncbi:NADase-type glycan-binding domain-containing protein [Streptomyces sp. NPDC014779]|uniref:NADase-type glycan-binding domain-containing protein n=1 Tax=unclassified Streptomyces TaxID=2593676 RepID=UPI0036FA2905
MSDASSSPAPASSASRACPECGSPVREGRQSFCDGCGAFLRWDTPASGPSAAPDPDPARPVAPDPAPAPAPAAAGAEDDTAPLPATPAAAPESEPADSAEPEAAEEPGPPRAGAGPGAGGGAGDTVARSLLVPVPEHTDDEAPPVAAPVLPARPGAPAPVARSAAAPAPVRDGLPCPACASLNERGRHFCRSCATPMVPEELDTADGPYAGRRPGLARDRGRWVVRALVAAGVVAVVVGGIVGGPPAVRAVQDHFATRVPVHPVAWTASHAAPKRDPKLAGDGYADTWWGTGYGGDSAGQFLEARFAEPTDLLNVLITPGSSRNTTQADGQAAPRTFDLAVTDSSGTTHVTHHRLNDGGTQRLDLRVRDALSVRLVLGTAWRADPRRQVAVAELEFFGRSVT